MTAPLLRVEGLRVVERLTRTDHDTLNYEVTIDDPGAYAAGVRDAWAAVAATAEAPAADAAAAEGRELPRLLLGCGVPGRPMRSALAVLKGDGELYPKFFGTSAPRRDFIPLVFNRLVDYAIRNGWRRINYGGGSHHAKLLRGCTLTLGWGVLMLGFALLMTYAGRGIESTVVDLSGIEPLTS